MSRRPLPVQSDEERERRQGRALRLLQIAVGVDWTIAALLLGQLLDTARRVGIVAQQTAALALLIVISVPVFLALGYAIWRGWRHARLVQLLLSGLLAIGNGVGVLAATSLLLRGDTSRLVAGIVLLGSLLVNLLIIWGFTRPPVIAWFTIRPRQMRQRWQHWPRGIAIASAIVGVVLAVALQYGV